MRQSRIGSIAVIRISFWSSLIKRNILEGEKGVVIAMKEPVPPFEDCGRILTLQIGDNCVINVPEQFIRFINLKLQKSKRNLERSKARSRERKEKRKQRAELKNA